MDSYDPLVAPDPDEWLAMDEMERTALVEDYHRRQKTRLPNLQAHAVFHVIAENQAAMGSETPAADKLQALMREGLDRHEAVHAIASVIAKMYHRVMQKENIDDLNRWYAEELQELTKKKWEESGLG